MGPWTIQVRPERFFLYMALKADGLYNPHISLSDCFCGMVPKKEEDYDYGPEEVEDAAANMHPPAALLGETAAYFVDVGKGEVLKLDVVHGQARGRQANW